MQLNEPAVVTGLKEVQTDVENGDIRKAAHTLKVILECMLKGIHDDENVHLVISFEKREIYCYEH